LKYKKEKEQKAKDTREAWRRNRNMYLKSNRSQKHTCMHAEKFNQNVFKN
jgi:hypothetical protein